MYVQTLYHIFTGYFAKGGWLLYPIFGVSLVAWFLGLDKFLFLNRFRHSRRLFLRGMNQVLHGSKSAYHTGYGPYDELLARMHDCRTKTKGYCSPKLLMHEFLISSVSDLNRGFSTIASWTSVAPFLGLLGTVVGMIETFRVITLYGLGNPNLMAEGISVALITTQAGLTVAFPMMLVHNYLASRAGRMHTRLLSDAEMVITHMNRECSSPIRSTGVPGNETTAPDSSSGDENRQR